jgi:hypothetical protein
MRLNFLKKTGCRKMFDFIGIQIHNLLPKKMVDMSLPIFKKYITQWLLNENDATKLKTIIK